jgi:hypothetical protein
MNYKFVISVVLVGVGLSYFGLGPSELLDRGGNFWKNFSSDFVAIFDGKANAVKGAQVYADKQAQTICGMVSEPVEDATTSEIVKDLNDARCEAAKASQTIILDPEALKRYMEEHKGAVEQTPEPQHSGF